MTLTDLIKNFAGVKDPAEDLNLTDDDAYTTLIEDYTASVKEWIDTYTGQSYSTALVYPPGLEKILMELVSNMIRSQVLRQDTPIGDADAIKAQVNTEAILTPDLESRLKPYTRKKTLNFISVVYNEDAMEEDAEEEAEE